jgi:hypothetical protein
MATGWDHCINITSYVHHARTLQPRVIVADDDPVNAIDPNGLDCGIFSFACSAYDSAAGGVKTTAKDVGHYVAAHKTTANPVLDIGDGSGRHPAGPRGHRSPGQLPVVVPRRPTRTTDQRVPPRRATSLARLAAERIPLHCTVPARHRAPCRAARPPARHSHQRRRRVATRECRRLDRLRRSLQPPGRSTRSLAHRRELRTKLRQEAPLRGIRTVGISDSARADLHRQTPGRARGHPPGGQRQRRRADIRVLQPVPGCPSDQLKLRRHPRPGQMGGRTPRPQVRLSP